MLNILLIDPDLEAIQVLFQRSNFNIIGAKSSEDGYELAKIHLPDIILVDQQIGSRWNYDFVLTMKSNFLTSQIPIMMMAEETSKKAVIDAMKNDVRAYLAKPISKKYLLDKIVEVNALVEKEKVKTKANTGGQVLYKNEDEKHIIYFVGRMQQSIMTDYFQLFLNHINPLPSDAAVVLDIRFLIAPDQNEMTMVKMAINAIKKQQVHLITGKNYVSAMVLDLDLSEQMFMSRQDFDKHWDLKNAVPESEKAYK